MIDTFDSKPEQRPKSKQAAPTRRSTRAQTSKSSKTISASKTSTAAVGKKKQKSPSKYILLQSFIYTPHSGTNGLVFLLIRTFGIKKPSLVLKDVPLDVERQGWAKDHQDAVLKELKV